MPLLGVLMNSYKNTDVLLAGPVAKEDDLAILGGVLLLIFLYSGAYRWRHPQS